MVRHQGELTTTGQDVLKRLRLDAPAIGLGLAAVCVLLAVLQGLWHISPHVPLTYGGDANLTMSAIRNMTESGWYTTTERLGAPFGQNLNDFPAAGDFLHLSVIWLMTRFTSSPGLVLNLFFLGTYPIVWLGAYVGARMLRLSRSVAFVVAMLYTFLPYHFQHGPSHLFLSSYWAVPLWVALYVRQLGDEPIVPAVPHSLSLASWVRWVRSPGTLVGLAIVVCGATTGLYYAVFSVLLAAIVALVSAGVHRSLTRGLTSVLLALVGGLTLVLQLVPSVLYQQQSGRNTALTERGLASVEFYSLKLSDMFTPVTGHRIPSLARLQADSMAVYLIGEPTEAIGLLGSLGLIALFAVAIARALRGEPGNRLGSIAVVAAAACLLGTVGGVGQLLGVFGFTHLRAWSRVSVVVAFCALVGFGIGLEHVRRRRWVPRSANPWVWGSFLAVITLVGVLDTNPPRQFGSFRDTATRWATDRAFVGGVEQMLGPTASVFQLPVVPFPENPPVVGMVDYDHLRGYLHSDSLQWSYGGIKGREVEWQQRLTELSGPELIESIAVVGFDGLWIDRYGYADGGASVESAASLALGPPLLTSSDNRLVLYSLQPLREQLVDELGPAEIERRASALLLPVTLSYGPGFSVEEISDVGRFSWAGEAGELVLRNFDGASRTVRLTFSAASAVDGRHELVIEGGGIDEVVELTMNPLPLSFDVTLLGQSTTIRLSTDAPRLVTTDPRDIRFRVIESAIESMPP